MNINAGEPHRTVRVVDPSSFDAIKVDPTWLESAAQALDIKGPFWFRAPTCENPQVFATIGRFVGVVARGDAEIVVAEACQDLARAIVTELGERAPPARRRLAIPRLRLRRVREALEHSEERISLDVLAREAGMSVPHMCAEFRRAYGLSIGECWKASQMRRARDLLLRGHTARAVALRLGFADQPHLNRRFRATLGVSPGLWLGMYRANSAGRLGTD